MKLKSGVKASKNKPTQENITKGGIGHDIKNSYINSLFMKSSSLSLYLITGVLAYAHKIPFLGRLITLGAAYYGRTTLWKLLAKLRKLFIIVNAVIGVFMVFKTAGFSFDNVLIGWTAIGETYLQTLTSLTGKLFKWFVELFDHKVIPNVPGDSGGTWFSKPKSQAKSIFMPSNINIPNFIESDGFSLRNLYKDAIPTATPWYKDTSTWLWIAGTAVFMYLGYKIICDPSIIKGLFKSNPTINTVGRTGAVDRSGGDMTLDPSSSASAANGGTNNWFSYLSTTTKGINNAYKSVVNSLNPFNYFVTSKEVADQFDLFMDVQYDMNRANRRLYPFTENNPFDGFFKRIRLQYYGETMNEWIERTQYKMHAERIYESLKISKGKATDLGGLTPIFSAHTTPTGSGMITPTAIGLHPSTSQLIDTINTASVANKLSNISPTPSVVPTVEWSNHTVDKGKTDYNFFDFWKKYKFETSAKYNKPFNIFKDEYILNETVESIEKHDNKFSALSPF